MSDYLTALCYLKRNDAVGALKFFKLAIPKYTSLGYTEGICQCNIYLDKLFIHQQN